MRVEQFNRYFAMTDSTGSGGRGSAAAILHEDCGDGDAESDTEIDVHHCHYDEFAQATEHGRTFQSVCHPCVPAARRRKNARLAVSRTACIEPLGDRREAHYEQRLIRSIPWHCPNMPALRCTNDGTHRTVWHFRSCMPLPAALGGVRLDEIELTVDPMMPVSFEETCEQLEQRFCGYGQQLVCPCCAGELSIDSPCRSCKYAVGFHTCQSLGCVKWRKGTLFGGQLDVQRMLLNLHRKMLPTQSLLEKADEYVEAGHIGRAQADAVLEFIERERHTDHYRNDLSTAPDSISTSAQTSQAAASLSGRLTHDQLQAELKERERRMQTSPGNSSCGGPTDQWRVYKEIVDAIRDRRWLRLMVQASAGTGKSFVLSSVYLWCVLNNHKANAAAPTGIAASNIEIPGTDVAATTTHNLFGLGTDLKTSFDFSKRHDPAVQELIATEVLLLDEVSMKDVDCWHAITQIMSDTRSGHGSDCNDGGFGPMHLVLFGDFKQLPPATSKAPFITLESVHTTFEFRVLRENRRLIADPARVGELENFHAVLSDIADGVPSGRVRETLVRAYAAGGSSDNIASHVGFEGSTSIFTKRRYRDAWNRKVVSRLAKEKNHSLKVKGQCRCRFSQGQQWFSERKLKLLRRQVRTQALWNLHLAGDWHPQSENMPIARQPHLMRVMMVSNMHVKRRFANGAQGRLLWWDPERTSRRRTALLASHPDLIARFAKEEALRKPNMIPDVDHIDITVRPETLVGVRGNVALFQLAIIRHTSQDRQ